MVERSLSMREVWGSMPHFSNGFFFVFLVFVEVIVLVVFTPASTLAPSTIMFLNAFEVFVYDITLSLFEQKSSFFVHMFCVTQWAFFCISSIQPSARQRRTLYATIAAIKCKERFVVLFTVNPH